MKLLRIKSYLITLGIGAAVSAVAVTGIMLALNKGPIVSTQLSSSAGQPDIKQVKAILELGSVDMTIERVIEVNRDNFLGNINLGQDRMLYIANGKVKAGFDLSQATFTTNPGDGKTVVKLPAPTIREAHLQYGPNKSRVYDIVLFSAFNPEQTTIELTEKATKDAIGMLVKGACANNILENANTNAKLVETVFNVDIETTPPGECVFNQ